MSRNNNEENKEELKKKRIKKIKNKIKRFKLPKDRLLVFPNPDKFDHEHWNPKRSKLNICTPFRALICGPPSSGKTVVAHNLILYQGCDNSKGNNKPFEEIYVIHIDKSKEYDLCGAKLLYDIPDKNSWNDKKKLVILEDLLFRDLNKKSKHNLLHLLKYISTHKNTSVIINIQDMFCINETIVRRCCNLFILFPTIDYTSLNVISNKIGLKKGELKLLFDTFCKSQHDSIWIDLTDNMKSPYKLRLNGFQVINRIVK